MFNAILRHAPGVLLALVALAAPAAAQASLSGTFTLTTAEMGRESLDVGGTWNGLTEVSTGDTVEVLVVNVGDDVAFDLDLTVTLPMGFSYAAGTAAGIPGISAVQMGTTLEFTLPLNTDIAAGANETITFGLVADTGTTSGTYALTWDFVFGLTDGAADGTAQVMDSVVVKQGAGLLTVDPLQQGAAVGDTVTWDVTLTNSGIGGIFDAEIDVSSIEPFNAASSLEFNSIVELLPGATGTVMAGTITFPYLAPQETVSARVTAEVTACPAIEGTFIGRHGTTPPERALFPRSSWI